MIDKLAEFLAFLVTLNEADPQSKCHICLTSTVTAPDLALVFSWDQEAPLISLADYLVHIYENLGSDDEMFIIAPFAYLVRLHNLGALRVTRLNMHK